MKAQRNCTAGQFPAAVQATFKQRESCQGQRREGGKGGATPENQTFLSQINQKFPPTSIGYILLILIQSGQVRFFFVPLCWRPSDALIMSVCLPNIQ